MQQSQSPMPTTSSMSTLSPMSIPFSCPVPMQPCPASLPAPLPMSTVPPCPAPVQPFPTPLPPLLPMPAAYLLDLCHTRAAVSCDKLFNVVAQYGRATAPNDKAFKGRNMTLSEMGTEYYGPTQAPTNCVCIMDGC
ncbi:hypothetical protein HKD37_18G052061 [Glycine soja]